MNIVFHYLFLEGKLIPDKKEEPLKKKFLESLKEGQLVEAIYRPRRPLRTIQMNKYLFGVVYKAISEFTGHSVEEIHELMKYKFLRDRRTINDEEFDYIRSTATLTIKEFEEYWNKVRSWAKRYLGIDIPEPNNVDYESIIEEVDAK